MLVTADPTMRDLLKVAENVAPSRASILITGESGTGKELLARFIHEKSPRSAKRMVAINCAAVPENLLESELFGHEKGAFTGAHATKPGKFEVAHMSTLLLDEMGEMPLHLQSKLLRVIQEGEIERVGGYQPIKVNVRILATTHRDLRDMVAQGKFREDLFYRLNVIPVHIPALRERPSDILPLARHFVSVSSLLNGKTPKDLSRGASEKIQRWSWPGNIRELENVIERSVLLSMGSEIDVSDLELPVILAEQRPELRAGMTISEAEKALILKTLDFTRQNRTEAARLLGISIRTLRNKLHEYREVKSESVV